MASSAENDKPIDASRLTLKVGVIAAGAVFVGGLMWKASSMDVTTRAVLDALKEMPTKEGTKSEILQAMLPVRESMTRMEEQLRALNGRVEKLESGNK